MMPIMKPKLNSYTKFLTDCKMFVKGSVTNIEKMKLPNVNQKSNYHIYLHKSTKFSAPITKLIIALLHVSVKRPKLYSCYSNSCMFV